MKLDGQTALLGVAGVVAGWLAYKLATRKPGESAAAAIGAAVGGAAVEIADGAATGVVKGIGGAIGVPDTDVERCRTARELGDTWGIATYCSVINDLILDKNGTKPKPRASNAGKVGAEPARPYQTPQEAMAGAACTGVLCGQTFESGAQFEALTVDLLKENKVRQLTSVAGLRG